MIFFSTCTIKLTAQDTTETERSWSKLNPARNDINANYLNVLKEDTTKKFVLAYRIQPTIINAAKNEEDSINFAQKAISRAINFLGEGKYQMALAGIYEALNICPDNQKKISAIANSYYAIIQLKIGNYSKAVLSLNKCDSIIRKLGNLNLLAFHYNNQGLYYQKIENQLMAENLFKKSLSLSRTLGDEESIAISLNNLSKNAGNTEEKIDFLNEAISINTKRNRQLSLAENFNNLAFQYGTLSRYEEAVKYLDKARIIAEMLKAPDILYDNYKIRSDIYGRRSMYKQAYESVLEMQEIKKEQERKENEFDVEQMIQNRILAKKQYELNLTKKEIDIKRLNTSLIVAISLFLFTLMLAFYIYYYINSRRKIQNIESKQKMAEQEAEHAQTELVNVATYLNTRNEILDNIQSALSKSCKLPEKDICSEIRKINIYIKSLQTKNDEVDSVLARITRINEGFIARLSEKHPELTKNDKNIALFLRARLSSKQIATLMDCSPKSVNMARYRMRTHLNLNSDTNLVSYLNSL
ncbi:MAG: hypothetical protein A2X18_01660 [Bacteroidetes bacterium GWF2_40_14]|nr:MAG: hypothetical protein A2X18_01660 [Bacteroidetes bacterium GWF2_40_14]